MGSPALSPPFSDHGGLREERSPIIFDGASSTALALLFQLLFPSISGLVRAVEHAKLQAGPFLKLPRHLQHFGTQFRCSVWSQPAFKVLFSSQLEPSSAVSQGGCCTSQQHRKDESHHPLAQTWTLISQTLFQSLPLGNATMTEGASSSGNNRQPKTVTLESEAETCFLLKNN